MPIYKLPKYHPIPEAALRLNEDIGALATCRELLKSVYDRNIHDDPIEAYKMLRSTIANVKLMETYAWDKMRQQFLAPHKEKIERKKPSRV